MYLYCGVSTFGGQAGQIPPVAEVQDADVLENPNVLAMQKEKAAARDDDDDDTYRLSSEETPAQTQARFNKDLAEQKADPEHQVVPVVVVCLHLWQRFPSGQAVANEAFRQLSSNRSLVHPSLRDSQRAQERADLVHKRHEEARHEVGVPCCCLSKHLHIFLHKCLQI